MKYKPRPLPPGFLARPIAHRGLHDAAAGIVENTAPAFLAAVQAGYGIECDVTPSRDGRAMVFHDATLERLTRAEGVVAGFDCAALLAVPFRQGDFGMMTLEALLHLVAGRVPLVVEVKSAFDGLTPLAPRLARLASNYRGPLVFKSFDPREIIALRRSGVEQPLGIVAMERLDDAGLDEEAARKLGQLDHRAASLPDFLSWRAAELPHPVPGTSGLPVMAWTIRSPQEAERVAPFADQIVFEGFRPSFPA